MMQLLSVSLWVRYEVKMRCLGKAKEAEAGPLVVLGFRASLEG